MRCISRHMLLRKTRIYYCKHTDQVYLKNVNNRQTRWGQYNDLTATPITLSTLTEGNCIHHGDVIMGTIASQISLTIVYSNICLDADQRKHQSSASLAFVRGIHRGPVNSPHKWPVTRKCFHLMTSSWLANNMVRSLYGDRTIVGTHWWQSLAKMMTKESSGEIVSRGLYRVRIKNSPTGSPHDDIRIWKHFLCYCPFVRGIHRSWWNVL